MTLKTARRPGALTRVPERLDEGHVSRIHSPGGELVVEQGLRRAHGQDSDKQAEKEKAGATAFERHSNTATQQHMRHVRHMRHGTTHAREQQRDSHTAPHRDTATANATPPHRQRGTNAPAAPPGARRTWPSSCCSLHRLLSTAQESTAQQGRATQGRAKQGKVCVVGGLHDTTVTTCSFFRNSLT